MTLDPIWIFGSGPYLFNLLTHVFIKFIFIFNNYSPLYLHYIITELMSQFFYLKGLQSPFPHYADEDLRVETFNFS